MLKRVVVVVGLCAIVLIAGALAAGLRAPSVQQVIVVPAGSTATTVPPPDTAPGTPPSGQVEITVASGEVPGCYGAGQPFRAAVNSRWGERTSQNVLTYRWSAPTASEAGIVVQVEGQTMRAKLQPGQPFPDVTLTLPLGDMKTKVTLTTFVFERRDASGKACFTWAQPPGTLRRFDVRPLPQEQARFEPLKQVRL